MGAKLSDFAQTLPPSQPDKEEENIHTGDLGFSSNVHFK